MGKKTDKELINTLGKNLSGSDTTHCECGKSNKSNVHNYDGGALDQALGESKTEALVYENVNHPKHYNNYDIEVIDMMIKIFGIVPTYFFCKLNAFKYRMRMGTKPDNKMEQDFKKEQWYLDKKNELVAILEQNNYSVKDIEEALKKFKN